MKTFPLLPLLLSAISVLAADSEIGFVERFALATNRESELRQLIPGTEDFYYYHALHDQLTGNADALRQVLEQWARRYPDSQRRRIIENRAALLAYGSDPQSTLQYLRDKLGVFLGHEQVVRDRPPGLPATLEQSRIAAGVFQAHALQSDDLSALSEVAAEALVREHVALRPAQVRSVLGKLARPDVPGVIDLVEAGLRARESRGFGEFPIHNALLPDQLDELAARNPTLFDSSPFVFARLRKMLPGADTDLAHDVAEREAWLDRTWAYASRLSPAFNTLKAQILFQRLQLDRSRGIYDKARFIEYLKLPRRAAYVSPAYAGRPDLARYPVDFNTTFAAEFAPLQPIGNDEWLVRDFLLRLLRDEAAWEPWAEWLRDSYVKSLFAEAKIVNGIGDPERWASLLSPPEYQALKERVDVDFSAASPAVLAAEDAVSLDLLIKNVPKLIVKVYELNTLSFFLTQKRQLNTDVNLDGLVANEETTHDLTVDEAGGNPFRRVPRVFEFPGLKGRHGAWIIEFIGGGKSSRALIRKGQWQLLERIGPAGDMLTVVDEKFAPVKDAAVWVDGRKLTSDAQTGFIVVPFTREPGTKPIILADAAGTFATLTQFEHHAEQYRLDAQIHVEREQLLARREATVAVRAALLLGDARVTLALLSDVHLTLTTRTLEDVATTREIAGVKLDADGVFTHTFPVPDRTASFEFTLSAKVENLSEGGTKHDLVAKHTVFTNGIDKTPLVADAHLAKFAAGYVLDVVGKNGEPLPGRVVRASFTHRDFPQPVSADLSTDSQGRVQLGALADIARVGIRLDSDLTREWPLDQPGAERPAAIHARTGELVRVPWIGSAALRRDDVSLLETRAGTFAGDHFDALSLADDFLEIKGLPAGDYSLFFREEARTVTLRISAATAVRDWLVSPTRHLEVRNAAPVHIDTARADADAVVIQVRNANAFTRVHVAASRFLAERQRLAELGRFQRFTPGVVGPGWRPNLFAAGRAIGDEYRYILERRDAKTYPGNMLTRPGLLLHPWEVRSTDLEAQSMAESQALSRRAGDLERRAVPPALSAAIHPEPVAMPVVPTPDLAFLATASLALYNLRPDKDGIVRIDRKLLGDRQFIEIYAEDVASAAWRTLSLPEVPTKFQDLRLTRGLDPAKAFTEKKSVTALTAGQALTLADILTSELETYDSLRAAHSLLATLNADGNFATFSFILDWPSLDDAAKRAKYSEFACHELNFFLSRKDPAFFTAVVQPYLRNKKDKTFMDDYLTGADLAHYLGPWAYARLNAVEHCLLAQQIAGERPATARHLRELWELLPPRPDEQDRLFETALRGRALSPGEAGSLRDVQSKLEKSVDELVVADAARKPQSTAAAAAPASPAILGLAMREGAKAKEAGVVAESMKNLLGTMGNAAAVPGERGEAVGLGEQDSVRLRTAARQYFREIGPTREWAENNYYRLPLAQQDAALVTVNAFWRDYAAWDGKTPFLSEHLAEASRSFTEMMLALAVIDLPFEAARHTTRTDGGSYTLSAASRLLAFHKQIKPAGVPAPDEAGAGPELLVSENFFRVSERYNEEGNEKSDRYVTGEFLSGVLYGANVVVTNPRSIPQKLSLLLQIPQGALPANGSKATDSRSLQLAPFTTQTFEYFFYFPQPAAKPFAHYPVHVSRNENVAGAARALSFKVVKQLSTEDTQSWDFISQSGTDGDVFDYLEQHNLARLDLEKVAWRARKSAAFFRKLTALLAKHHVWSEPIARYALLHNDSGTLQEWLRHRDDFLAQCGPWLASKLITIDPIERRAYEHLEYSPLVNQRAHRVGAENRIPNPVFRAQYQHLLEILAHKPALEAADEMSVVYCLFLQDRIGEALARFHAIQPGALPTRLQHDYFRCYAAFYEEQTADARKVAATYASYPVDRWRKLFAEVTAQLDEIDGKSAGRPNDGRPDREAQQAALAATEPSFDFTVENRTIALNWKHLRDVTINYYLMDPEFLFSASPFVTEDAGRFSIIKPTQTAEVPLPAGKSALEIPLPAAFAKANVLVEVLAAGQRKALPYHANTLKLTIAENYGRLDLRDTTKDTPVANAYVKVYARLANGTVRFFKDGYTDLRGKFDYASLNSSTQPAPPPHPLPADRAGGASGLDYQMLAPSELESVERLAILILSENHGAKVREVAAPSR